MDELLILDCSCSCMTVPTSRLIEIVKTIIHDPQLVDLINRFCNLPIRDERGLLCKHNTCFPQMSFIFDILKNILLEDMDSVILQQCPKLNYIRFQHEIRIPLYERDCGGLYSIKLDEIFKSQSFYSPNIQRVYRGMNLSLSLEVSFTSNQMVF